jgi:tryptophanyl-tRNA synthetase
MDTNEEYPDILKDMEKDNEKLIANFGASKISTLKELPDFRSFHNGLVYSHRDFDKFYKKLKNGEKSAVVSGVNPSGTLHIGHLGTFGVNLFLQQHYNIDMFIPLSDDESYVAHKIETQEEALKNALFLVKSFLAFGFKPGKTKMIIDQIYTNIYNMAFQFSRNITVSTVKAVYDYPNSENIGLHFYPAVQASHIALPQNFGIKNVVVPISPDEDAHIRVSRDIAELNGYEKAAILHTRFMPGIDGKKMAKSKGNAIFLFDPEDVIKKKIMSAFSGGRQTVDEHRRLGGVPEADVSFLYLKYYFLDKEESDQLYKDYKSGKLLSGELKKMLLEKVLDFKRKFDERYNAITHKELSKVIMRNEDVDIEKLLDKFNV